VQDTSHQSAAGVWIRRGMPLLVTVGVFALILRRIPFERLIGALREADYAVFLAYMIPNAVVYFCWDTFVLATAIRWFHGPIRYSDLLPARAVSYVVSLFNTNLARGALAGYLARRLRQPLLQLGSTVIFLTLTEYTHLVSWATLGLLMAGPETRRELLWILPTVAATWLLFLAYTRFNLRPTDLFRMIGGKSHGWMRTGGIRDWDLLRTFRIAPLRRYVQTVLLRAPLFFFSLCLHYLAAGSFGIHVPFTQMIAFLPIIFMIAALPITVAHLGTTQAAWIFFFSAYAPPERLLVFSLAAHATFTTTRALLGILFAPKAYTELIHPTSPRMAA
jgi:hypothetical protein